MSPRDYHTYPPVGHCIYCGARDCDLSKEHIIPYSLNGNWVLPKASCTQCQKKTQKIEEVCTHERYAMFYGMRRRFGMQSRSKSTRLRAFLAEVQPSDGSKRDLMEFESDGFPAVAFGMKLPPAGILTGSEPTNKILSG